MLSCMTEAELSEYDDPTAPNVPARLPGHQGPQAIVPVAEQRERRMFMSGMLSRGVSRDEIIKAFEAQFGMTESGIGNLMSEVRGLWEADDADELKYAKSAARRRIHRHIREAAKDRKFTAVANLEKVLSDVEGTTIVEEEKTLDVDGRVSDAILAVLGSETARDVRIMIEKERMLIELSEPSPAKSVIDVEGTSSA